VGSPARTTGAAPATGTTAATGSDPLPDRIVLSATKEQLENAPGFRDNMRGAAMSNRPAGAAPMNNTGAAPTPRAPAQPQ
jgi:hypothetical protein